MTALKPEARSSSEPPSERDRTSEFRRGPAEIPVLAPASAARIGSQLRSYYGNLMQEPIPDRFVQLLEELQQKEGP